MDAKLMLKLPESLSDLKTVTTESLCRKAQFFASIIHYSMGVGCSYKRYWKTVETTRQTERVEYRFSQARINKTNKKIIRRTKLLFNHVSRVANDYGKTVDRIKLQKVYWNFFTNHYVEEHKCTWRVSRRCGNCYILKKIKLI